MASENLIEKYNKVLQPPEIFDLSSDKIGDLVYWGPLNIPRFASLQLTNRCNLRCNFCNLSSGLPLPNEFTTIEWKKTISDLADFQVPYITCSGGEPTILPDLPDIIAFATSVQIDTMLFTNGALIDKSMARRLSDAGLGHARVSIDGSTADVHDTLRGCPGLFDKAIRAVSMLLEEDIYTAIAVTLGRENYWEFLPVLELAESLGAGFYLYPLVGFGRGKGHELSEEGAAHIRNHLDKLDVAQRLANHGVVCLGVFARVGGPAFCRAGEESFVIRPNGDVKPCSFGPVLGNLRDKSIQEIWRNSPELKRFRLPPPGNKNCAICRFDEATCLFKVYCRAGCRAIAWENEIAPAATKNE